MKLTEIVYLDTQLEIFFILTEPCRAQHSETPCDQLRLGTMSFKRQYSFISLGSILTRSAPGYRITNHIHPSRFTNVDLGKYVRDQADIKAHAMANDEPVPEEDGHYRVKVYVYCPPCVCQVATALDLCENRDNKTFVEFCIRIDHRQMTSCSASGSRIEGLISVIEYIKEEERLGAWEENVIERLKAIDREWLERQIYDYTEEDRLATLSPANQLARIAELHKVDTSCAAIILLGEADYCIPLIGAPPFPPFEPGRVPRETQLFRFWKHFSLEGGCSVYEREYMGTYSPKAPSPPRRPAPVFADTTQNSA